jgi:2-dehydro-3-deoxy-D-gluconate 5-dehydrogenase
MRLFDLKGKVAVVTGGNGGIGFGISCGLAEAGATVAIAALDEPKAWKAVAELETFGVQSTFLAMDVTNPAACREMVEAVEQKFGGIDILVNNAGIVVRKRPEDHTTADWQSVLDVNLNGAFHCAQAVYRGMASRGGGKIINIGSMLGTFASPSTASYAASKGAIMQLTRALAVAWAKDNIRVNAVLPGWIDTDMTRAAREEMPGLTDHVLARTPARRWGDPEDMAGVAIFLASAAADFVTGAGIPVDGGYGSLA